MLTNLQKRETQKAKEAATRLGQLEYRTPWIVAMCGYVYNRTAGEKAWSSSAYHSIFKFSMRAAPMIGTMFTEDLKLTIGNLDISGAADFFWLAESKYLQVL